MNKLLFSMMAVIAMTGCKPELRGTLNVVRPLQVVVKGNVYNIPPGRYAAEYTAGDKAKFAVLKISNVNGQTLKVQLASPPGQDAVQFGGRLNLPSSVTGQPFDVVGGINTDTDRSDIQHGTQSCSYTEPEYVCRVVRDRENDRDGRHGRDKQVCGYEPVLKTGTQEIEFYYSTTSTGGDALLLKPGSQVELARFQGSESDTDQVITWAGDCRRW